MSPSTADAVTRGLVAHYRFDEASGGTVLDATPSGNNGVLREGGTGQPPRRIQGKRGMALEFADGASVEVPRHPSMALAPPFTVAFWAKASPAVTNVGRLIANGEAFDIKLNDRNMQLSLNGQYAISDYDVPLERWTHFAVVFEAGRAQWFIDGGAVPNSTDTFNGTRSPETATLPLRIGTSSNTEDGFLGAMDDVRLYAVTLTLDEIRLLAAGEK